MMRSGSFWRILGVTAVMAGMLMAVNAFAGTVGKISGAVTDENDVGIPGVTVQIEGTKMGAAASFDGSYVILNVPPGTYTLVAQSIGYNKMTIEEVKVQADVTTEINFQLTSEAIKTEDVVVIAETEEINKYITSNEDKISGEKIKNMPVTSVGDVLRTTTGFVRQNGVFHARGGRGGEVVYMVDGIEIKNYLGGYGEAYKENLELSATDISELSVLKGNYDAEYGGANSAIINVVRKEGDVRTTTGRIEFLTDDLGFSSLNDYSYNEDRLEWNLSGPIPGVSDQLFPALGLKWPGEKMAYFLSFSMDKYDKYPDYNSYSSPNSKIDYGHETFLGVTIPNRRYNEYTGSAKLTWKLDANARYRLAVNYFKDWIKARNFAQEFLYTPQTAHTITESKEAYGVSFQFSPSFLRNTYGELKLNQYVEKYEQRPGGLVPGDFVPADNYESFTDRNNNGQWDAAEPFIDTNGDGFFGEPFTDIDGDGLYNPNVDVFTPFTVDGTDTTWVDDLNHNGRHDADIGEPYSDLNGNGQWDQAETINNDQSWIDNNGNGVFDEGDWVGQDEDGRGNGVYDPELRDVINEDRPEPYTDGDEVIGEPFIDVDFNGVFNGPPNDPSGPDIFIGAWDLNGNGEYDGPDSPWSEGVPFRDLNNNGRYDAPNGQYDYGEPYVDRNGNGRYDYSDGFWDYGFDQWALYHKTNQSITTLSFDLTSQVAKQHEIKSGLKFSNLTLKMSEVQYPHLPYDGLPDGGAWPDRGVFRDFYTRTPKEGAFYVRDKMEYGEMVANVGFRYDFYIQANEIKDIQYASENYQGKELDDSQNKFSPRVAFSFPVSDKAKLFFNYGHFYQLPAYRYFFRRPTQASNAAGIVGNPNLSFEKTISYELGIQYKIASGYILGISGYYKDIYGLLNSIREVLGPISNDVYGNIDYARTRGVELQLEKRYGHFFAGSFTYEYTWAYGKNSSESADYFARFYRQEIPIQETPLDWDIRHQLTVNGDIRAQKGRHPKIGVFTLPDDWSLNFIWQFKTGKPFTPDVHYPGLILVGNEQPLNNSKRMPYYSTVDIRFDKNFQLWKLNYTMSLRVNNLFDNKNINDVYSTTGLPYTNENNNGQIITGIDIDEDATYYEPGRQVQVGLSLNF
jgi:outer membrane receptor protein involved in Fe transport